MTAQHHIPVSLISPGLLTFGNELIVESSKKRLFHQQSKGGGSIDGANYDRMRGRKLGGGDADSGRSSEVERISNSPGPAVVTTTTTARERALAAAEKRRRAADGSGSSTNSKDEVE
jgi:hypothetical protein